MEHDGRFRLMSCITQELREGTTVEIGYLPPSGEALRNKRCRRTAKVVLAERPEPGLVAPDRGDRGRTSAPGR